MDINDEDEEVVRVLINGEEMYNREAGKIHVQVPEKGKPYWAFWQDGSEDLIVHVARMAVSLGTSVCIEYEKVKIEAKPPATVVDEEEPEE